MKICFAAPLAAGLVGGGLHTQLSMTADALAKLGVQPVLFNQWASDRFDTWDLLHVFRADIDTLGLVRYFSSAGIPIVVSPVFFSPRSPGILKIHRTMTAAVRHIIPHLASDFDVLAEICHRASAILPNTIAEADFLVKGIGVDARKITVVHNAVEDRFRFSDPAEFRAAHPDIKDFVLASGGLGVKRKNMLGFIRAMQIANLPAVILGERSETNYGRECGKELKKSPNIRLLPHIPHDSSLLASAYAASRVFAMPSLYETPGIAAMEAALAGASIVTTPFGGPMEYFNDMALYTDPSSPARIAKDILRAWESGKSSEKLRVHLAETFNWNKVALSTLEIYRKILA